MKKIIFYLKQLLPLTYYSSTESRMKKDNKLQSGLSGLVNHLILNGLHWQISDILEVFAH